MLLLIALFFAVYGIGALVIYHDDPRPQLVLVAGASATGLLVALAGIPFIG
jgi:hypothetical protein